METRGFPSPPRNGFGFNRAMGPFPLGLRTSPPEPTGKTADLIGEEILAAKEQGRRRKGGLQGDTAGTASIVGINYFGGGPTLNVLAGNWPGLGGRTNVRIEIHAGN